MIARRMIYMSDSTKRKDFLQKAALNSKKLCKFGFILCEVVRCQPTIPRVV